MLKDLSSLYEVLMTETAGDKLDDGRKKRKNLKRKLQIKL